MSGPNFIYKIGTAFPSPASEEAYPLSDLDRVRALLTTLRAERTGD